jgi:3-phenylpropionate/cinnamic acid dioxygenase small subunit
MRLVSASREAIEKLVYLYAERIDQGDLAGVGELFANAEIHVAGSDAVTSGRDAVRELYETTTRRYPDGTPKTKHLTTNLIIDIDEAAGRATCRSYFTVLQQTSDLPLQVVITGRYRDRFVRTDKEWQFAAREMALDQFGDLSQHLLVDAEALTRD